MRFNFKKIAAIGTSVLLTGMSMGFAAAAAYPAPFVVGGVGDVGIVYGANAPLDVLPASNINLDLSAIATVGTGSSATTTGETYALFTESSNGRLYMNASINSIRSSLTESQLPNVLADSTFEGSATADVTQSIKIGPNSRILFGTEPTSDDDPVVHLSLGTTAGTYVYNATVSFSQAINFASSDSLGETLSILGRDFTVGAGTTNASLFLYESSEKVTLTKDVSNPAPSTTVTVGSSEYTVTLVGATDTAATVSVTDSSGASEQKTITTDNTKKIQGVDVSVSYAASSTATSTEQATISVGSNKLRLPVDGSEAKVGSDEDIVDGTAVFNPLGWNATTSFTVQFFADDTDSNAIVEGGSWVDPLFGGVKLDFPGLVATARETIGVTGSSDKATMTMTTHTGDGADKNINWYYNASATARLADSTGDAINVMEMAQVNESEYAVVGNEDEGYLVELRSITNSTDGAANDEVIFRDVFSGKDYTFTSATTEGTITGQIGTEEYTVTYVDDKTVEGDEYVRINYPDSTTAATDAVLYPTIETSLGAKVAFYEPVTLDLDDWDGSNTVATLRFPDGDGYTDVTVAYAAVLTGVWNLTTTAGGTVQLNTSDAASTKEITIGELVYNFTTSSANATTISLEDVGGTAITLPGLIIFEEKDGATTPVYNALIVKMEGAGTSTAKVGVADVETTWGGSDAFWDNIQMQSDNDMYKDMDYYGSVVTTDRSDADAYSAEISYPDVQVYGLVYLGESSSTVSGGSAAGSSVLGNVIYKDSEIASLSSKNLIIVGGSCINSAAATLVGGNYCDAEWTTATEVGSGEFLIQSFGADEQDLTSKIALLVAGYDASDTLNAATYLVNQNPDVAAGNKWIGSTQTSATLQVD